MKRALFTSKNLIGDGLYISRALSQWHRENPDYEIDILTNEDHVAPIYTHMGVPVTVYTLRDPLVHYDFEFTFDVNQAFKISDVCKCHITEAYAMMLGVYLPALPKNRHLKPIFISDYPGLESEEMGLVLVSMFSASCSSRQGHPPNKMLPWPTWVPVLRYLRMKFGNKLRFLGAPTDRAPELKIPEDQYMTGIPLNKLALIMKCAKLVVTLDNGMSHLAASQEANEVVLYPAVLGLHYIAPIGNPNAGIMQMDPSTVDPASVIIALKTFVKDFKL